jgi:hypothetical protein
MTATELVHKYVNKTGTIEEHGLTFNVKTKDVRTAYGSIQVLIVPLAGNGARWIDAAKLSRSLSALRLVHGREEGI